MEFLEVLTEGLERVLLVRGGGSEVITIYSWLDRRWEDPVQQAANHGEVSMRGKWVGPEPIKIDCLWLQHRLSRQHPTMPRSLHLHSFPPWWRFLLQLCWAEETPTRFHDGETRTHSNQLCVRMCVCICVCGKHLPERSLICWRGPALFEAGVLRQWISSSNY